MDSADSISKMSLSPPPEPVAKTPELTGKTLNDFQLVRKLGQGGMGQVYLARQLSLKRQVAVKILRPELAANQTALQRFRREAEAVAGITHANIVQIYQIGEADNLHYMALEYVEGRNLREFLNKKGPPELPIALNIMRQIAAALQRAGELGFVHRDIKPENILLTRKGEVKVTDFGLSRCFSTQEPLSLTQSGVTMGTPLYMSPEQVQGKTVDPRSDIYSFGVTCYHMLCGEPPFRGNTAFEVALQHVQNEPSPLASRRPDLPTELCQLVHKMMAKNPDDRYQTPREILRDLARVRESLSQGITAAATIAPTSGTIGPHPKVDSNGMVLFTESSLAPVLAPSKPRTWLWGGVVLIAAMGVGIGVRFLIDDSPHSSGTPLPPPDSYVENAHEVWFRQEEAKFLSRIDDKELRRESVVDSIIELLLLYVSEKKWDAAEELLAAIPKKPALQDNVARPDPKAGGRFIGKFYVAQLAPIGRAIVLAYRDDPVASNKLFLAIFTAKDLTPKKDSSQPVLDYFFNQYPRWRKAVADALDRNAKNLNPTTRKLEEPPLERFRSYAPRVPMVPEKKP